MYTLCTIDIKIINRVIKYFQKIHGIYDNSSILPTIKKMRNWMGMESISDIRTPLSIFPCCMQHRISNNQLGQCT